MATGTVNYVTIDIEITPSTTGSSLYQVDASIRGVPSKYRSDRKVSEEIAINLEEWKDLDKALNSLHARGVKEEIQVRDFGKNLFQQVMGGAVYTIYKNGKDFASNRNYTLRLRLHLGAPELIEVPWEILYEEGEFLALSTENPRILIMRCPRDAAPVSAVEHHLPLQITIMTAESKDRPVSAEKEKILIKEKLEKIANEGKISIKEVKGTIRELENILINKTLDIFHFIGHGSFNSNIQEGELILEDGRNIPGYKFSKSLPNNVKLVFLNACESARGNDYEPASSIAHILAKQRRVVIAMQFQISVPAAVRFASVFYSEIAGGAPIDVAVAKARLSVFTMAECNPLDWAAPVLYMKSDSGVLFDIKEPSPPISNSEEADDLSDSSEGLPTSSPLESEELLALSQPSNVAPVRLTIDTRLQGTQKWSFSTGKAVRSSPTVANNIVYFGSNDCNLYALDASSGQEIWRPYLTRGAVRSSPAVANNIVYFGSNDCSFYALDASSGHKIWSFSTHGAVQSSPVVVNGVVYFGSNDHYFYALDAVSGLQKWSSLTRGPVRSSPVINNGMVYFGSNDHNLYALDAISGLQKWSFFTNVFATVQSSPAVANGIVYFGSGDGKLYALDAASGSQKWFFRSGVFAAVRSSPTVVSGVVYFGSRDYKLYALDAISGKKIWSFPTGKAVESSPAVVDGMIYFGSDDHNVYALNAATRLKKWSYRTDNKVQSSPTVVNGVVYVGSDDCNLCAILA